MDYASVHSENLAFMSPGIHIPSHRGLIVRPPVGNLVHPMWSRCIIGNFIDHLFFNTEDVQYALDRYWFIKQRVIVRRVVDGLFIFEVPNDDDRRDLLHGGP